MSSEKKKEKKKVGSIHVYRQEKILPIVKTSCWIYVRYIAGVLKTSSNLAAKSKALNSWGGAASWLVACKSNKYEVIVHGQNNSLDLFIGGLLKEISMCWVREKGFHGIFNITSSEVTLVMFQRSVANIADILMALIALMAGLISLLLTHIHFFF